MNAEQRINYIQNEIDREDDLDRAREQFAQEIVEDLRVHGRADYYLRGKQETVTFDEVIESWDGDLDADIFRLYSAAESQDLKIIDKALKLTAAIDKHVQEIAHDIAVQVIQ